MYTVCSLQFAVFIILFDEHSGKNGFVNHFQLHTYVKHSVISGDRSCFLFCPDKHRVIQLGLFFMPCIKFRANAQKTHKKIINISINEQQNRKNQFINRFKIYTNAYVINPPHIGLGFMIGTITRTRRTRTILKWKSKKKRKINNSNRFKLSEIFN